jgi:hypothetical protein
MSDKPTHRDRLKSILDSDGNAGQSGKQEADGEEVGSPHAAFGYLRGIKDLPGSVELRFRSGNSLWFPYGWLGPWQYNPSDGLLLKFSGDLVYLVLIRGSNLDKPVSEGAINLTTGGLQRHRVVWVREMTETDIRQVGETGPTIDRIEVAEFESHQELREWLKKHAPAFLTEGA